MTKPQPLHLICERDVGLFSLIQQVIANVPWALTEGRKPIAFFRDRCVYFTPASFRERDNVWEYYFEPLIADYPASTIDDSIIESIDKNFPKWNELGRMHERAFVTANFGDHPELAKKAISIPYLWDDPDRALRQTTAEIIQRYVRPRKYIKDQVKTFWQDKLKGHYVVGVHLRATDSISSSERRAHRFGSLSWRKYLSAISQIILERPDCKLFLATDSEKYVTKMTKYFGNRVVTFNSIRHQGGSSAGLGPNRGLMPAYIAADRNAAARNGYEAVVEYLLLSHCNMLVHNSSSLARTVLLNNCEQPHINTHLSRRFLVGSLRNLQKQVHRYRRWRGETDPFRINCA
ncbi:MAG: hypothetical protein GY768_05190 [Planctomycetaceae bacterium]|nr:hypothetical protein [Planctomycetaceae bacterium]